MGFMSDNGMVIEDGNQREDESPISINVGEPCGSCDDGVIDADGVCTLRCEDEVFDDDERDFTIDFADPGGESSLRAATATNPRNQPCPDCGEEDVLTPLDVACGYHCDACSDQAERGF